ncbi:hypothetical protein EMIHUDRAFT_232085 [Emiliania huxleyi CCMP1516]|uniref:ShKT domain-containing protein n=2 Tax=Emiliania huxleyi TaxID=2903 RepID=A0A0D3K6C6_EMIH1|nr:hypothetical protein EMIHUDRAFT_232085 [Emiliania huxleyi CCMP1516]EOD31311.1 hypothetical protein EMIHUDRAFT_232085 [Emiliania huxleyi CCMP1516]|eukprot:XP_005783740.1 hypothetical protein EMIHUDRAFT_232085 [Emiliania huxleyi CCMP1516]
MLRKCPVSCGICSPVCEDGEPEKKHPAQKRGESHCDFRARLGHCEGSNAESMMRDCPVACKICRLKPADTLGDCAAKAADGACQKDALNLLRSCPLACGLRRLDGLEAFCHDFDPNACGSWAAAGQCEKNPDFMLRSCGESCGLSCSPVCEDHDSSCATWFANGECDKNPIGMRVSCPRSCGICHGLAVASAQEVQGKGQPAQRRHPAQRVGESVCDFRARLGHCDGSRAESMIKDCPGACKDEL